MAMETDEMGGILQQEYGDKDPNTHIQFFYLRLGKKVFMKQPDVLDVLKKITKDPSWVRLEPRWRDAIYPFESVLSCTCTNERAHEEEINDRTRKPLQERQPTLRIIISRACLYTESMKFENFDTRKMLTVTTNEIGNIMDNAYGDQGNSHIEQFYLFVQASIGEKGFVAEKIGEKDVNIHDKAFEVLKSLPGNWKSVEPPATWGGTFFSLFPKVTPSMTERDREKLLNGEVRLPLIETLEAQLVEVTERGGQKPTVQVIITRACKYTPPQGS